MPITGLPEPYLPQNAVLMPARLLRYLEAVLAQGVAVELGALELLEAELGPGPDGVRNAGKNTGVFVYILYSVLLIVVHINTLLRKSWSLGLWGLSKMLVGRALLDELAVGEEQDAAADLAGEVHLVRDDDHGHALLGELLHDVEHLADHLGVEGAGGLVKEHDVGVHAQCADDCDTLLLAAGELDGIGVRAVAEAYALEQLLRLGARLVLLEPAQLHGGENHVLDDRLVREEVELLEHHAHLLAHDVDVYLLAADFLRLSVRAGLHLVRLALLGDVHALEEHGSLGGLLEQVQRAQQGALAAAGGADDDDDLALVYVHVHAVQGLDGALVVVLLQAADADEGVGIRRVLGEVGLGGCEPALFFIACRHGASSFQSRQLSWRSGSTGRSRAAWL